MSQTSEHKPKGVEVVRKYEEHAMTSHGRLRHDLLYMYYDEFIAGRSIDWIFDVGGGSGFLVKKLAEKYPDMKAVLIDADEAMVEQARENLSSYASSGRVHFIKGAEGDFPEILKSFKTGDSRILVSFNHAVEYVKDQMETLRLLTCEIPKGSFFGIMYLNNSHEAYRKLYFRDSPSDVLEQLKSYNLDMVYFGMAKALNAEDMEKYFATQHFKLEAQYGMRCVSDFKAKDFVEKNYDEILKMEVEVGKVYDFMGLARYRLKFFLV